MAEDVTIEISDDEIRIGDYYLKGKIPDKLAWIVLAAFAAACGLNYDQLAIFAGGF